MLSFKNIINTALKADAVEDDVLYALAHMVSTESVCADLQRSLLCIVSPCVYVLRGVVFAASLGMSRHAFVF